MKFTPANDGGYLYTDENQFVGYFPGKTLVELRDLLLREFPVEDAPHCGVDFYNAERRLWSCELPKGHEGRHAAPGVNEIQHLPPPPATSRKERRERIATAVLAARASRSTNVTSKLSFEWDAQYCVSAADALIATLDKEA